MPSLAARVAVRPVYGVSEAALIDVQAQAIAVPHAQITQSADRMKYPPIPSTRFMPSSCQDGDRAAGDSPAHIGGT